MTDLSVARLYEAKQIAGLVDVKFLHKALDEGSPAQIEADLVKIHKAIGAGSVRPLHFGDRRLKRA